MGRADFRLRIADCGLRIIKQSVAIRNPQFNGSLPLRVLNWSLP